MPNQNVFCNSPWYELHIYWDGSYGFCCAASHKAYPEYLSSQYCVQYMSIREWFDSEPMRSARQSMFADTKGSLCARCHDEERFGAASRRHRSNQKSIIFTRSAFDQSYAQSPGHGVFEHARINHGRYDGLPIDLHIDLGNYCNLACKMCAPSASSKIASQYQRWNIAEAEKYIRTDWTKDDATWNRIINEIAGIKNLKNIHFMGGETLLTTRFEDFVDFMIDQSRFDLCFSFVTNGTLFNEQLMHKLSKFARVGIEVSIESLDDTNIYQRQGTDQAELMRNLERYRSWCDNDKITLTLRPAISALTIGSYHTLLNYADQNQLIIKSVLVRNPRYLDVRALPLAIRENYAETLQSLLTTLDLDVYDTNTDLNESDPNQIKPVIKAQIQMCLSLLLEPELSDAENLRAEMVAWCRRWDVIYGLDARKIYPEFETLLDQHGY